MKTYQLKASGKHEGIRLGSFISEQLPLKLSKKAIKRLIDLKQCRVNGSIETFASYKIKDNDQIELAYYEKKQKKERPSVLYEDDYLIVINKPSGLTSVKEEMESALSITPLFLVHRLDKETTGALILAKTSHAAKSLEKLFYNRVVKKVYHAICLGLMRSEKIVVENQLAPICEYDGGKIMSICQDGKGKTAKSIFKRVCSQNGFSFVHVEIITGVTHQIRCHAKHLHLPVFGDFQYDKMQSFHPLATRLMLHAKTLEFPHPINSETVTIDAPYPKDIKDAKLSLFNKTS